ncbi:hypothetical protein AMECASPLE_014052 [Ameca splendens]|uniref:Uncharacterized protein n=1 Tax=Ameca splendens TaxID=208324 RepID=A0ABV0Y1K8_9TELE
MWRDNGSTPSSYWMAELRTLSQKDRPATLRRKLISSACIRDLVLWLMTQMFMPIVENHGLGLEELIFIPAASHSAANRPNACCRSWLEGASRTMSSAKRREEIHWSPNQTSSSPWLRLEILSIKVMNRTKGDIGQACQSTTCTWNRSDLVLAMMTKLLLRSWMTPNKGPPTLFFWSTPHRDHERYVQMHSPCPQRTCGTVGQTPMNPVEGVIALSKQQGLLHSPRSEDGGSIRYRALTDQDPSPPASTTGAIGVGGGGGLERTGSIVRVEAHPESRQRPVVKPPSIDGSGSWRWKPPEQRASLRQSTFALNDLNRHTDSCDSLRDGGSVDGRRSVTGTESESEGGGDVGGGGGGGIYTNHPRVVHPLQPQHPNNPNNYQHPNFNPSNPNNPSFNNAHSNFNPSSTNSNMSFPSTVTFAPPFHPYPQAVTTIRVTPVEATAASSDGGSDCQSVASSSRESTLRRKGSANIVHVQDRGPTPDLHNNHRPSDDSNRLENESSSRFHENLRNFQENPIQPNFPNRQMQAVFGRPSPTPPPTLPRPLLTHTPPPTLGLAYKE